jgi:hypothetical protein
VFEGGYALVKPFQRVIAHMMEKHPSNILMAIALIDQLVFECAASEFIPAKPRKHIPACE